MTRSSLKALVLAGTITVGSCTLEFAAYISHMVRWVQAYHSLLIFTILYIVEPSVLMKINIRLKQLSLQGTLVKTYIDP